MHQKNNMRHPTLMTYVSVFWLHWMQNRALNVLHTTAAKTDTYVDFVDHPQSRFGFGLRSEATWDSGNIAMIKQEKLTQTVDGMQTERPVLITPGRAKLQTASKKGGGQPCQLGQLAAFVLAWYHSGAGPPWDSLHPKPKACPALQGLS